MINKEYDVIVIGGGPAGGQFARELSAKGYKVLLTERHKSFKDNNFSSAGMTLEPLTEFNIPESVVGAYWENLEIQCSENLYSWNGTNNKGVVLDFGRLRQFLADETIKNGSDVLMGHTYLRKQLLEDGVVASFKTSTGEVEFKAKLLIDGTGPSRRVVYDGLKDQPKLICGGGVEYLIEVSQEVYDRYKKSLFFFLGDKWAYKGYSWIFPMENRILKVGAGKIYIQIDKEDEFKGSMKKMTEKIIKEYLNIDDYRLIDIHGGTLKYSPSIKDTFYKDRVVAIGDAVSTVNPLGGEGIRYAMQNARLAANYVDDFLKTGDENFVAYRKKWRNKHLLKWQLSEASCRRMYAKYSDDKIERRIGYIHQTTDIDSVIEMLFNFKFNKLVSRIFEVYKLKLVYKFNKNPKIKFK